MTLLVFLLVLSVLVFVHELGHFLTARILGIRVEEFAFGLPFTKPIISVKRLDTAYSIYPIMFGGFVKLFGEEAMVKTGKSDKGQDFWSRGKLQRIAVIAAGVIMNVILAMVLFVTLYMIVGVPTKSVEKVTLVSVDSDSPAGLAGLLPQDRIIKVEEEVIESTEEFSALMKSWVGVGVNLTVERGPGQILFEGIVEGNVETRVINLVPRANPPEGQGALGVGIASYPYLSTTKLAEVPIGQFAIASVVKGGQSVGRWMGRVLDGLRQIGRSLTAGKAPEGVAGPVGIYQLTGIVVSEGWLPVLELVAILSVNLAVFNILPFPALDGGRIFFILIEAVRGKRMSPDIENRFNSWGMAFLLGLIALITLQDVLKLGK